MVVKKDIVKNISKRLGYEGEDIRVIIDCFMDEINDAIALGKNIQLRGLGTFNIIETKERVGRDMFRNKEMIIPAKKKLSFKPGKAIINGLNNL